MDKNERADEYMKVARVLSDARDRLDALTIGDPTSTGNRLKHLLDDPIEQIRSWARVLYVGELPATVDRPAPIRTRAYLHTATEPRGKPEQTTNDAGELYCPNYACEVREIPVEQAEHHSSTGLFFCPKCGTLLDTPPARHAPEPVDRPELAPAQGDPWYCCPSCQTGLAPVDGIENSRGLIVECACGRKYAYGVVAGGVLVGNPADSLPAGWHVFRYLYDRRSVARGELGWWRPVELATLQLRDDPEPEPADDPEPTRAPAHYGPDGEYSGPYYVCADCAPGDAEHFGVFMVQGFDAGDVPACPRCLHDNAVTPAPLPSEVRQPDDGEPAHTIGPCPACAGSGNAPGGPDELSRPCPACNGSGLTVKAVDVPHLDYEGEPL